ncbi:hypothetical protein D3C87_2107710 [compost metagenome]
MIANAFSTSTIPSMTVVIAPSWSATVVPVNPASAKLSFSAVMSASEASGSNQTVAEVKRSA